jgi:hypothetical protein
MKNTSLNLTGYTENNFTGREVAVISVGLQSLQRFLRSINT